MVSARSNAEPHTNTLLRFRSCRFELGFHLLISIPQIPSVSSHRRTCRCYGCVVRDPRQRSDILAADFLHLHRAWLGVYVHSRSQYLPPWLWLSAGGREIPP